MTVSLNCVRCLRYAGRTEEGNGVCVAVASDSGSSPVACVCKLCWWSGSLCSTLSLRHHPKDPNRW